MLTHLPPMENDAKVAILTGNPTRVPFMAETVGTPDGEWSRRGFTLARSLRADGEPVLVCSTGIGGPSTAIVVEELIQMGVESFVRVGTCGSIQKHINAGHLVVSTGCVRDEGTSGQFLPPEYPTVPDFDLLSAIAALARDRWPLTHVGVTHCKDAYYAEAPEGFPLAEHWSRRWEGLRNCGVLATEMEAAALFAMGMIRGKRSAGLFVAVDETLTDQQTLDAVGEAARIAVDAACSIGAATRID
ncbi:nucleoside phosphorylase [Glycomyces sp. L485]|uniref:nucleoside phosphorylase n=1 Tax=Glycomyces sp. L485 TaxID=2909235 RepID=UPI001F4B8FA3|nr:nucleoside phosphorylase [Glycomyces sp. L485]MCH7230786.1 nucleoside phosphorylase [Glycomyces sp. L485]